MGSVGSGPSRESIRGFCSFSSRTYLVKVRVILEQESGHFDNFIATKLNEKQFLVCVEKFFRNSFDLKLIVKTFKYVANTNHIAGEPYDFERGTVGKKSFGNSANSIVEKIGELQLAIVFEHSAGHRSQIVFVQIKALQVGHLSG